MGVGGTRRIIVARLSVSVSLRLGFGLESARFGAHNPSMTEPSEPERSADAGERRRDPRRAASIESHLEFVGEPLNARSENISRSGALVYADGELKVQLTLDLDGGKRRVEGRIVRMQRMLDDRLGLAIEFDEPLED